MSNPESNSEESFGQLLDMGDGDGDDAGECWTEEIKKPEDKALDVVTVKLREIYDKFERIDKLGTYDESLNVIHNEYVIVCNDFGHVIKGNLLLETLKGRIDGIYSKCMGQYNAKVQEAKRAEMVALFMQRRSEGLERSRNRFGGHGHYGSGQFNFNYYNHSRSDSSS